MLDNLDEDGRIGCETRIATDDDGGGGGGENILL
jgi:hypothetical protein